MGEPCSTAPSIFRDTQISLWISRLVGVIMAGEGSDGALRAFEAGLRGAALAATPSTPIAERHKAYSALISSIRAVPPSDYDAASVGKRLGGALKDRNRVLLHRLCSDVILSDAAPQLAQAALTLVGYAMHEKDVVGVLENSDVKMAMRAMYACGMNVTDAVSAAGRVARSASLPNTLLCVACHRDPCPPATRRCLCGMCGQSHQDAELPCGRRRTCASIPRRPPARVQTA